MMTHVGLDRKLTVDKAARNRAVAETVEIASVTRMTNCTVLLAHLVVVSLGTNWDMAPSPPLSALPSVGLELTSSKKESKQH